MRDRTDLLTGWKYSIYPGRQYSKPNLKARARIVQSDNRELARACSSKSTLWSGSSPPCHPCSCCWKKLCGSVCCYPEDRISNMFLASTKGVRGTVAQAKKISKNLLSRHCKNPYLFLTFVQFPFYYRGNSSYSFLIIVQSHSIQKWQRLTLVPSGIPNGGWSSRCLLALQRHIKSLCVTGHEPAWIWTADARSPESPKHHASYFRRRCRSGITGLGVWAPREKSFRRMVTKY